uniref:Glycerol-3-phosphate acyltransferase 3 n=1 Tax=Amphiprion percula TaxID=161767 RepID=A0A3P8UAV6_AMPPE
MQEVLGQQFALSDVLFFCKKGLESIVDDQVTQRFSSEELASWNLLTRTNQNFRYISLRLTIIWGVGVFIRYGVLFPLRFTLAIIGLFLAVIGTTLVGFLPDSSELVHLTCYRICARGLSATVHYHNKRHLRGQPHHPIDVVILANDGCYAMGCWRSEMKDRTLDADIFEAHVAAKTKLPILIFPEGTCINNTSVMMFKKGSFEIGGPFIPCVSVYQYDPRFGDAFWNSSKFNMVNYLLRMMTSWAIVVNVWYLPPMTLQRKLNFKVNRIRKAE